MSKEKQVKEEDSYVKVKTRGQRLARSEKKRKKRISKDELFEQRWR